jgi:drug/metabolite transporter (DMT)-like permease
MPAHAVLKRFGLTGLLVIVIAIWGWSFTVVRDAVASYGVLAFLAIRFSVASAALAPLALRKMSRRTLGPGLAIGLVLALGYLFQTLGLKYTTPTNCGLVTGLFIIFVPFFDRVLHGIRVRKVMWLAVGASLAGMMLLEGASPKALRTGDLLTFIGAGAYGLHVSLLSRYSRPHNTAALTMAQMLAVALLAGAACPFFEPLRLPPAKVWWAILATAVLASAAAFYVQTYVQQRVSALRTGILLTLEPLFAMGFGYLLAGDRLRPVQLLGAAILMCGIVIAEVAPAVMKARQRRDGQA